MTNLVGKGRVRGTVNGETFAATYTSIVDPITGIGKVEIKGIPKSIGPGINAWTILNVTGVCLIGAKEINGGKNFGSLTDGKYSRSLAIQFPTGEALQTEASFITQPNGEVEVDVVYNGTMPSVQGMEARPSTHTLIHKGSGAAALAGVMNTYDPTDGLVKSAPVMASYYHHSGKSLSVPMKLGINPIKTEYDPITETVLIEVEEFIEPL